MKKNKFLRFFKEEIFFEESEDGTVFVRDRLKLILKEGVFFAYISDNNSGWIYLTTIQTVKELKKVIKLL
jgi:hypothetical protein